MGYCIAIAYLHKTTRFYMLTNAREVSFLPHYKRPPSIFQGHHPQRTSTPMREPVSSTAINRDIPDLTSRRNTRYDKFLCAWKKVNSNSLFCISKYIIVDQNHISNPSHITLRSIVCIEIISTHSSVGLHGSLCIAGRIEPEYPP